MFQMSTHGHSYHPMQSKYAFLLVDAGELQNYEVKNITPNGMRQAFKMGQELRRRYISEFGSTQEVPKYERNSDSLNAWKDEKEFYNNISHGFIDFSYKIQEFYTRTSGNS